jgi:hypothetical protein
MIKAPVLQNEVNRRETIRRYGALDTHSEQDCENVAPLAFHISWISRQGLVRYAGTGTD